MFLSKDLDELLACDKTPAVSLYLPTHRAGREIRQDAIRLRNLLSSAEQRLAAELRPPDIAALLDPARKLVDADDEQFWANQEAGLAVFLAPGFSRIHKLPLEVAEELAIGKHFSIRPLLPILDSDCRYWVLTVSAGRTKLYQGSRWTLAEVSGLDLPQGISGIWGETEYQETHYASPVGPSGAPGGLDKAQSFGEAPNELHKSQLIELLRRVAAAVEPAIKAQPGPVVLAAVPALQGNFREIAAWKELLPSGISENPDAMRAEELHEKSWRLIEPRQEQVRADTLGRLQSLLGTGDAKATTRPEDIVKAAHYGRIERLFLCDNTPVWGHFVASQDRVVAHGSPAPGDSDLLDLAATMTLRQGGSVSLVDRTQLPPSGPAAAILRY